MPQVTNNFLLLNYLKISTHLLSDDQLLTLPTEWANTSVSRCLQPETQTQSLWLK